MGNYGLTLAKFVNVEIHKSLPPIGIDGGFKVFISKNNGKKSFLLAISVDKTNEHFFKRLEHSLAQLASAALPCTKPEDFKIIKERKNYRNVYCKIYMHYSGSPKCYYSELVNGRRRTKSLEDAAFENFKDSCVVRIIHAFSGKTKGITICADEIINYDSHESYFDEFPEE